MTRPPSASESLRLPRRNRVDPFGDLHPVEARGLFTGNRGCLVDDDRRLVRHHHGSLWIICVTEFRGWRHPLDAPHRWTPLFFLDDAVALAAGHRPCGFCRPDAYRAYREACATAFPDRPWTASELNRQLATERLSRGRGMDRAADRRPWSTPFSTVPVGAVVLIDSTPHLVSPIGIQAFSFDGWGPPRPSDPTASVNVLTPPLSVAALCHGFVAELHPTAAIVFG